MTLQTQTEYIHSAADGR